MRIAVHLSLCVAEPKLFEQEFWFGSLKIHSRRRYRLFPPPETVCQDNLKDVLPHIHNAICFGRLKIVIQMNSI